MLLLLKLLLALRMRVLWGLGALPPALEPVQHQLLGRRAVEADEVAHVAYRLVRRAQQLSLANQPTALL